MTCAATERTRARPGRRADAAPSPPAPVDRRPRCDRFVHTCRDPRGSPHRADDHLSLRVRAPSLRFFTQGPGHDAVGSLLAATVQGTRACLAPDSFRSSSEPPRRGHPVVEGVFPELEEENRLQAATAGRIMQCQTRRGSDRCHAGSASDQDKRRIRHGWGSDSLSIRAGWIYS